MAKPSLTLIQPARTPERQRLADAILERDRRAALVHSKKAEKAALEQQQYPLVSRRYALEDELKFRGAGYQNEIERLHALLTSEASPPAPGSLDAMRAELAAVTADAERLRGEVAVIASDVRLLESAHSMAADTVREAAGAVIVADPATAAVFAEHAKLTRRVMMLNHALDGALNVRFSNGGMSMGDRHTVRGQEPILPCPWQAARDCLASDPDARLPMPEEVFAEPSPRSAA